MSYAIVLQGVRDRNSADHVFYSNRSRYKEFGSFVTSCADPKA